MLVYQRVCPNSSQELLAMGLLLRSFLPSHECFCWPWCSLWLAGPAQENALAQNSQEPNLLTSTLSKDAKLRKIIGSKTQHVNKLIKIYKNQINQTQQKNCTSNATLSTWAVQLKKFASQCARPPTILSKDRKAECNVIEPFPDYPSIHTQYIHHLPLYLSIYQLSNKI